MRGRPLVRLLAVNDVYKLDVVPQLAKLLQDSEEGAKSHSADATALRCVAGDFLSPNILSPIDKGRGFLKAFNRLGFTHACFGNHEADLKERDLALRCKDFAGVWLNSNVPSFLRESGYLRPYDIVSTPSGDLKVGLIGLISDEPNIFADDTFKGHAIGNVVDVTLVSSR